MNYPIVNNKETYKGATFYLDSVSFKDWFVAPDNNPWINNAPISVGGRTVLNSRKEYIVASEIVDAFSQSKGGVSITPISLSGYEDKLELNISFGSDHQIKLDILNSLPYPSLIFSATLLNSAPDFDSVLKQIKDKLSSDTLLKGNLAMLFKGVEIINKILLSYNLHGILNNILGGINSSDITEANFFKAINGYIETNFNSLINTTYSTLTQKEIEILKDFLFKDLSTAFVAFKNTQIYFDEGLTYTKLTLRDPMELEDKIIRKLLLKSNLIQEKFLL